MGSRFSLILVLVALTLGQFSFAQSAQEGGASSAPPDFSEDLRPVSLRSTRFDFDISSVRGSSSNPVTSEMSYTSYFFELQQDLSSRLTVSGSLPILIGQVHGNNFNELGNPFAGINLKLLELQEYHPLWLSVHGGIRFARPDNDVVAAARYQEYHSGLSLTKQFGSLSVITDGNFIQKLNDSRPGVEVGNEIDGYGGLRMDIDNDWSAQAGYEVRHADPLRSYGAVIVSDDLYTEVRAKIVFHLSPMMDLTAAAAFPTISAGLYQPNQQAFGDVTTQATLGRSWSLGVNVGI